VCVNVRATGMLKHVLVKVDAKKGAQEHALLINWLGVWGLGEVVRSMCKCTIERDTISVQERRETREEFAIQTGLY